MRLTVVACNYFKKYVQREIAKATGVTVRKPFQGFRDIRKKKWYYDENRPWTSAAKETNISLRRPPHVVVQPISKKDWKLFKGDRMAFSTSASSGIHEGMLLGLGNPLLDISIQGDKAFLDKYDLLPNNAIIAEDKHHNMFAEMTDKYSPSYLAGGATQNSIRVAQWLLEKPDATTFFGGVGADQFCKIQEEKAREVGVHVCYQVHQGMKTGVCGAIITGENRSLVTELGAAEMFSLDYLELPENWKFVEKAQFYYIGGFLLPVSPASVLKVLKHAADKKKTVIMNLHATFLCKYFTDADLDVMPYVDVLFGNGDEAAEFSKHAGFGTPSVEEIASKTAALPKINSSPCRTVVFTQGRDPTYLAHDGKVSVYPVKPVDPSVIKDTNGCGDSFVGGFLSQLVQGRSIDECVRCGSYAAKAVIQHYGCTFPPKPDFK